MANTTERELIEAIQAAKADMAAGLKDLIKMQIDASNPRRQNAAFLTLAELNVWHGKATERLFEHFPEFAGDIVAYGPGR